MSKILLLIISSILFSFSSSHNISDSNNTNNQLTVLDDKGGYASYINRFFSGIADNVENSTCIKSIEDNRSELNELIEGMLGMLGKFEELLRKYGLKLIKIPGLIKNCQFANLFKVYFTLNNKEQIELIGQRTVNCSANITYVMNKDDDAIKIIGYIIKILFDLKIR